MKQADCPFCKIADRRIETELLHDDDVCVAFNDLEPQAPTHILVIPKKHIASLDTATGGDKDVIAHLLLTAAEIARKRGFAENGYRIVVNCNADGGQTVFHLHVHMLAGRRMVFPPG